MGVLLHATVDPPAFVGEALRLVDVGAALARSAVWAAAGAALWVFLARIRSRRETLDLASALDAESGSFAPLYLRPALTLLALLALALRPTFPYGFTLPVALTQDLAIAQDAAALAAFAALRLPAPRLPAPGAGAVFFMAFLLYALLSPPWAREWDSHPGNEPKYLRMGVSLGHALTLDVEGVSASMEQLAPRPFLAAAGDAGRALVRESLRMLAAVARGPDAVGVSAIRATRITRQTIAGKEGGVFHVLAPGPSLLLAPTLRLDRAINRARGTPGRLAVTLVAWNALGAALVAAVFLLVRDATGRAGLAAALAGVSALSPPFLFYFYQFYPEMPGALLLALALRLLIFAPRWTARTTVPLGLILAALPWLHQKFLPVWGVLVLMALVKAVERLVSLRAFLALLLPQVADLFLTALYNFAITGSVRPDALFLAWGPGGVSSVRIGQGLLGLLLDARYGILPYAPIYLLAAGGVVSGSDAARRMRLALPAAAVYYLTVASADNWSGAICSLGRYVMPVTPLLLAWAGVALVPARRGAVALGLTLAAWTGLLAIPLRADPHAANDCALLLARSAFADGNVYIPNLFIRSWSDGAPGLVARILVWVSLVLAIGAWLRHGARAGRSLARALAGTTALVLAAALFLERWPSDRRAPRFRDALEAPPGSVVFVSGSAAVERDFARTSGGVVDLLVRARRPLECLTVSVDGEGVVKVPGRPPLFVPARGGRLRLPLEPVWTLAGSMGEAETLYRQTLRVEPRTTMALRFTTCPP